MTQRTTSRSRPRSAARLGVVALASLASVGTMPHSAAARHEETAMSSPLASQKGHDLAETLRSELARVRATPAGLGMGNGPGVDISEAFRATLPQGTPEHDVIDTLKTAGFRVRPASEVDGERIIDATLNMDSRPGTEVQTAAVITLRSVDGAQRLSGVSAALIWSSL